MMEQYALDTARQVYRWRGQRIAYYVDGPADAPAVVLVHSINAAASSFEMRKTFAGLRGLWRVYAFDLLGFGASDRPAKRYSADEYAALIADFTREVVGPGAGLVASSLGAAYAVRAAAQNPGLFGRMVLICPTGIVDLARPEQPGAVYALLYGPMGDLVFAGLRSKPSIRYFLTAQAYYDTRFVDEPLIEGFYQAAQAPGAKYAPICFLTGLLNCDIREDFGRLRVPMLLVWGRDTSITPLRRARDFLSANSLARLEVFERARLSLQDEHPERFHQVANAFLCER